MAIEVTGKFKPKSGKTFSIIDAEDVEMPDGTRLSEFEGGASVEIVNNLTSTATNKALSANQGRVLQGNIDSAMQSAGLLINACVKSVNGTKPDANGNVNVEVGASITVDSELSATSENPVQNKVINGIVQEFSVTLQQLGKAIPTTAQMNALIDAKLGVIENGSY